MSKFNLTFSGEIVAGVSPRRAKSRFGKMFQIDDPERIEQFFSGDTIILRRNLDRKTAAQYYSDMHKIGLAAQLVKATTRDAVDALTVDADTPQPEPEPEPKPKPRSKAKREGKVSRSKPVKESAQWTEDEETARKKAAEVEAKRKAAAEAEEQAKAKEKAKTEAKAEAARKKAEKGAARLKKKQEAKLKAEEEAARKKVAEEEAKRRAEKEEAARKKAAAPKKAPSGRVKTSLEVPNRNKQALLIRKRQPGEPNLYQLRPFRNSAEIKARAGLAQRAARTSIAYAALALLTLCVLVWQASHFVSGQVIDSASLVATMPGSGPLLVAGSTLVPHDRAGIPEEALTLDALGLAALPGPMAFDPDSRLIAWAQLAANTADSRGLELVRCNLEAPACQPLAPSLAGINVDDFAINPLDRSLLVADTSTSELLKISAAGEIVARNDVTLPARPSLVLQSGLLFVNSALGPAISVFRYDDNAFGQQLDEVLLVPPPALEAGQTATGNLARLDDSWWVTLQNPETRSLGIYRFDGDWNYLGVLETEQAGSDTQLVPWGNRMLLNNGDSPRMERFNAQGQAEVPFVSSQLEDLSNSSHRRAGLIALAWRAALITCVVLAVLALLRAHLQRLRALVYKSGRERGAEPVEDHADALLWVDHAEDRRRRLQQRGASYAVLVLAAVALAISQEVDALSLAALLIAAAGPAIALLLTALRPTGNIARLDKRLLLVDHRGLYQLGEGPRIQHRGGFLVLDDIIVHTGNRLLPTFSPKSFMEVAPQAIAGAVKVDSNTIVVKLLEARHPLAQGGLAIAITAACALALLAMHGIF